jgi:SOS-response transcriptional repressor LexA
MTVADIDRQTLDCIKSLTKRNGYAPTYWELADCLGLKSKSPVHARIHRLLEAGLVVQERRPNGKAIRIVK